MPESMGTSGVEQVEQNQEGQEYSVELHFRDTHALGRQSLASLLNPLLPDLRRRNILVKLPENGKHILVRVIRNNGREVPASTIQIIEDTLSSLAQKLDPNKLKEEAASEL